LARRRIIHEEEEKEQEKEKDSKPAFKPSEFNETEFLQTENKSAKMIYISLGTAVLAGLFSFGIMRFLYWLDFNSFLLVPIVSPFLFAPLVAYLFQRFGINIRDLEWKKWLENGFMYVLAWFVIWMLSMNPPISDFSDPLIEDVVMEIQGVETATTNYTYSFFLGSAYNSIGNLTADPRSADDVEDVRAVTLYSSITDNWKIDSWDVEVYERTGGEWVDISERIGETIYIGKNLTLEPERDLKNTLKKEWLQRESSVWKDHIFSVRFDLWDSDLVRSTYDISDDRLDIMVVFKARDSAGNRAELEFTFTVKP
jgi:hypothetical protein